MADVLVIAKPQVAAALAHTLTELGVRSANGRVDSILEVIGAQAVIVVWSADSIGEFLSEAIVASTDRKLIAVRTADADFDHLPESMSAEDRAWLKGLDKLLLTDVAAILSALRALGVLSMAAEPSSLPTIARSLSAEDRKTIRPNGGGSDTSRSVVGRASAPRLEGIAKAPPAQPSIGATPRPTAAAIPPARPTAIQSPAASPVKAAGPALSPAQSASRSIKRLSVDELRQRRRNAGASATSTGRGAGDAGVADEVDCSVFAPLAASVGEPVLVQVFLHLAEQAPLTRSLALMSDTRTVARPSFTLQAEIKRGAVVEVELQGQGLQIEEHRVSLKWRGEPTVAQFSVRFPTEGMFYERKTFHPVVRLFVDGVPVGRIIFVLEAQPSDEINSASREPQLQGTGSRRYSRAFLSYSTLDRRDVLRSAQVLKAANIEVFQDVLSLDPGDDFRDKILGKIKDADVFMLFWSAHAAKSEWVEKEWQYALAQRMASPDGLPDIIPVPLAPPNVVPPPEGLANLHFNSPILSLITTAESKPRSLLSWLFGGRG